MTAVFVVVALMLLGMALIAVEVLVLPGFGFMGVLGTVSLLGAGYVALAELPATIAGLAIGGSALGALGLFWYLPRTRTGKSMVLQATTSGSAADPALADLHGRTGTTLTPLRPSGAIEIDDQSIDVISDGQYIEIGTRVRIIDVSGNRVVVEAANLVDEHGDGNQAQATNKAEQP